MQHAALSSTRRDCPERGGPQVLSAGQGAGSQADRDRLRDRLARIASDNPGLSARIEEALEASRHLAALANLAATCEGPGRCPCPGSSLFVG